MSHRDPIYPAPLSAGRAGRAGQPSPEKTARDARLPPTRRAHLARAVAAALMAMAALGFSVSACDGRKSRFADSSSDSADEGATRRAAAGAWAAQCAAAAADLDQLQPHERAAHLLRSCPVCDVGRIAAARFDGSHADTWLTELDAAIERCGGYCTPVARTEFLRYSKRQLELAEHSARPWRKLAEACPGRFGVRPETRAFLGATWFALARIVDGMTARMPAAARAGLWTSATFPLPAQPPEGKGLDLPRVAVAPALGGGAASSPRSAAPAPPAGAANAETDNPPVVAATDLLVPDRLAVSILADRELVTRLPWATLTGGRIEVDGMYPGDQVPDLAAAVAAATTDHPVSVLAPRLLPAARLVEALGELARPARLLVAAPSSLADLEPPYALRPRLTVTRAANDTLLTLPLTATPPAKPPLSLAIAPDTTIEELVAALAALTVDEVALVATKN